MDQRMENLEKSMETQMKSVTDALEKLSVRMEQIATQSSGEHSTYHSRGHGGRRNGDGSSENTNFSHSFVPKTVKIDFPRYDGNGDPTSWLCRVEQFFELHETPSSDRVSLASFHLEGDAQIWYQLLKQEKLFITWEEFKEGLDSRYAPNKFLDFFGELTKLQQTGNVQEYQSRFEKLLAKAGPLPQARQVSCFISGLKDSIRTDVQANRPDTLSTAIGLARLYEARDTSHPKSTPVRTNTSVRSSSLNDTVTRPVKMLTLDQLNERKKKGLCFRCNEQFAPGHRCKKLFSIQACQEESDDDVEMEIEEQVPEISLHAIAGTRAPETMRVMGKLGDKAVTVLIDSGSTHNFVCEEMAKRVRLQPTSSRRLEVMVASGEKLSSSGKCPNTQLNLQGVQLYVDFYILPLEGYDVVLGTQWLSTLGRIEWDFSKLQMKFKVGDKEVLLHGLSTRKNEIVSSLKILKASRKNNGALVHLYSLYEAPKRGTNSGLQSEMRELLTKYKSVFSTPTGLPPQRVHDHHIPLQPGQGPVSVKPYRYPYFQKSEIEKIVAEMLSTGVIQLC